MPTANNSRSVFAGPDCDRCGETQSVYHYEGENYPYCPNCGDPMPRPDLEDNKEMCELCDEQPAWISHHTSYVYNLTIEVCSGCHGRIHDSTDKYREYEPKYSRSEAIEAGMIDPTD